MGLGSGIREKPIPDPGVKKAPDPGSGSAKLLKSNFFFCLRNCTKKRSNKMMTSAKNDQKGKKRKKLKLWKYRVYFFAEMGDEQRGNVKFV